MPDIQTLLAGIPELSGAGVTGRLSAGPASENWLVEKGEQRMVVRTDKPRARELGLDRYSELVMLEAVSDAGIGPRLIAADPEAGWLVTGFVPGAVWTRENLCDPAYLKQLAAVLRRLHSLPATGPRFDPGGAAQVYARDIGTEPARELAARTVGLADRLMADEQHFTLCHNDLLHHNMIGSDPVCLIDWEYAAVGDPVFDVAIVVRQHDLPESLSQGFLQACIGPPDRQLRLRFDLCCTLYDLLSALWYMSVCQQTGDDPLYTTELERVIKRIEGQAVSR